MRWRQVALLILMVVLFSIAIRAGELTLSWQPPDQGPTPTGYRVYTGLDADNMGHVDIGPVLSMDFASLPDCATNYMGVKGLSGTAETQMSVIVSVYPRPSITDLTSDGTGTHTIVGNNFDVNLKVYVDAGSGFVELPAGDVDRVSCTEVKIPSVPIFRVQVANVTQPIGHGEPLNIFSQPWPAPTGVMVE